MKKLGWVVLVLVGLVAGAAEGQLAVYGKGDLLHNSQNENNSGLLSSVQTTFFYGGGVGVYDDFLHLGPLRLGVDVRGDLMTGDNFNYRDVLGGVRVAVKLPVLPFRPYVQGSLGTGGTKYTGTGAVASHFSNKLTYAVFGGVDTRIFPHVDFRAVEVGVGQQTSASDTGGAAKPVLVFVSSGLVVRF